MLDTEWLATFAPLGRIRAAGRFQPNAAGVFLLHEDVVWLATAHHVIESTTSPVGVVVSVAGSPTVIDVTAALASTPGLGWIASTRHDVCIAPMPTPPGIAIKAIDPLRFLRIVDITPSMPSVIAGCPYGLPGVDPRKPTPILLDGIVAGTEPASETLFLSTPTFPGNSGGPIFVHRSALSAAGGLTLGQQTLFLAGIVTGFQIIEPVETSDEPLRLGVGVASDVLVELLEGERARSMSSRIKQLAALG